MYTIGIVCSGNTCRSPIAAAWLRAAIASRPPVEAVEVWTAGMAIEFASDVGVKPVEPEPLRVAEEMGLPESELLLLRQHRVRDLQDETRTTDLLAWITVPSKLSLHTQSGQTRAEQMRQRARTLNSLLLVVPEPDDAWQAKDDGATEDEVLSLYREQAVSLREWSRLLYEFIPQ